MYYDNELALLAMVALLWLVVVPIIILIKLASLRGKVRGQEDFLQWKIAKLEERLGKLESGAAPLSSADAAPLTTLKDAAAAADTAAAAPTQASTVQAAAALAPLAGSGIAAKPAPKKPVTDQAPAQVAFAGAAQMACADAGEVDASKAAPLPSAETAPQATPSAASPAAPKMPPLHENSPQQAQSFTPGQLPPKADPRAGRIKFAPQLLRKSNMWVLGGTVLLLCALVFLAKLAIDAGWYTPALRLATGGLLGVALLIFGWRSREGKPQLGQILQGGGVAAFYLVVVAAVKLHDMLPAIAGLPLLLGLVALASVLAVMQNAPWMAHVSMIAGFLAPRLMSDGSGNYVALFTVFLVLNAGIMFIFARRGWAHLCLTGFVLTYGMGGIWGLDAYEPHMWTRVEPFLLVFTAAYGWVAWRLHRLAAQNDAPAPASAPAAGASGTAARVFSPANMHLFFALATPTVFLIYQLTVVGHLPLAMAFTGLGLGFVYLAGAKAIWKLHAAARPYDAQTYLALAVTGLNLALLFAGLDLDTGAGRAVMLFYLGVIWVVEGGLFIYITRRNPEQSLARPKFMRYLGGALLVIGSGMAAFHALHIISEDMSVYDGQGADVNIHILAGTILAALACLAAAWGCRAAHRPKDEAYAWQLNIRALTTYSPVYPACFALLKLWLVLGLYAAFAEFTYNLAWSGLALAVFICGCVLLRARLAWKDLQGLLFLPLIFALPVLFSLPLTIWQTLLAADLYDFTSLALPLEEFAYTYMPLAVFFMPIILDCLLARRLGSKVRDLALLLAPGLAFLLIIISLPSLLYERLDFSLTETFSDAWFPLPLLMLALLALGAQTRLAPAYGPQTSLAPKTRLVAWYAASILPLAQVLFWQFRTVPAMAAADPLPYLPVLNPLDLGALLACLALWFWQQKSIIAHNHNAKQALPAAAGMILVCLVAFAAGHGVLLRAVAILFYNTAYTMDIFSLQLAQVSITLYWGACGFALMLVAARLKLRRLWICGALLLLAAALKAVVLDTSSAATLARVAVYFGIGVLFICAGYFIPVPGGRGRNATPKAQEADPATEPEPKPEPKPEPTPEPKPEPKSEPKLEKE